MSYASIFLFVAVKLGSVVNRESTSSEDLEYIDLATNRDSYILKKEDFDISVKFDWFSMDNSIKFEDWIRYFDV